MPWPAVITFLLIEKAGRRTLTVPPQWLCAVVLAIIGLWAGAPAIVVLIIFLVFSFFQRGVQHVDERLPGEVLPTEIRGIGTGFAAAVSRVGAGIGIFLLPMFDGDPRCRSHHADRR
ncbi:MFS transporter [Arthrobacter sp. ISL-30]|uniref:MFS transporter n=1 Tax=Arthrobacter sp. ISL-30 TaxID=2819109 RepID=UPI001BE79629|nr:MFS transporter [Arthrobacter sp. ISL-30]MBT2514668.1 MFS transporter [Arthrobacter sp. ISL-30]